MYAKIFKANPTGINQYTPGGMNATTGKKKPGSVSMTVGAQASTPEAMVASVTGKKVVAKQTDGWNGDLGFVHEQAPRPAPLNTRLLAKEFVPKDKATDGWHGMFGID